MQGVAFFEPPTKSHSLGTVLEYKRQHKMGRFAPAHEKDAPTPPPVPSQHLVIGGRCEVTGESGEINKRGTIRFVGPTNFGKGGDWVGVEYDEPVGKNDGSYVLHLLSYHIAAPSSWIRSVQGEKYFTCKPNHGGFVRADRVTQGDFPVEEYDIEEM